MNTDKSKPIDQESREFIKWTEDTLIADSFYSDLAAKIVYEIREFYSLENKSKLMELLR